MRNADHKLFKHHRHLLHPQKNSLRPEIESHIPILINNIVDPLEDRIFRHGDEDVVAGRPKSIGILESIMPTLPIPIIPHLTVNKVGIAYAKECHFGPTQGVGLHP